MNQGRQRYTRSASMAGWLLSPSSFSSWEPHARAPRQPRLSSSASLLWPSPGRDSSELRGISTPKSDAPQGGSRLRPHSPPPPLAIARASKRDDECAGDRPRYAGTSDDHHDLPVLEATATVVIVVARGRLERRRRWVGRQRSRGRL